MDNGFEVVLSISHDRHNFYTSCCKRCGWALSQHAGAKCLFESSNFEGFTDAERNELIEWALDRDPQRLKWS